MQAWWRLNTLAGSAFEDGLVGLCVFSKHCARHLLTDVRLGNAIMLGRCVHSLRALLQHTRRHCQFGEESEKAQFCQERSCPNSVFDQGLHSICLCLAGGCGNLAVQTTAGNNCTILAKPQVMTQRRAGGTEVPSQVRVGGSRQHPLPVSGLCSGLVCAAVL